MFYCLTFEVLIILRQTVRHNAQGSNVLLFEICKYFELFYASPLVFTLRLFPKCHFDKTKSNILH